MFIFILVLFFLVTGVSVFFRSPIMSYSYVYFPMFTEKYSKELIVSLIL